MRFFVIAIAIAGCASQSDQENMHPEMDVTCSDPGCIDPSYGHGDATTGTDATGWWFASGSWHVPLSGPEDAVLTGFSVDLIDNGPGNAHPAAPVTVALRSSRDGGGSWTTITSATSCGCGAEQTIDPGVVYRPAGGEILELAFASQTSDPSTILGLTTRFTFPITVEIPITGPYVTTSAGSSSVPLSGSSNTMFLPFTVPAGVTILSTGAVISDNVTGPTRLKVGLATDDGLGTGALSASTFGSPSAGNGSLQLISSPDLAVKTEIGKWYAVEVVYASGTASATVRAASASYVITP